MAHRVDTLQLDNLSADPSTPADGEHWYNSTSSRAKVRVGGSSKEISHKDELDTHEGTANPHGTTLENARTAGATLSGPIDMGGSKITNVGAGTVATDAASLQNVDDKIAAKLQGFVWQDPIIDDDLVTSPGSPVAGDRYIIAGIGGAWSGFTIDDIAEFDGSVWSNQTPAEGFAARILDEDQFKVFNGTAWEFFGLSVDHGNLVGLTDNDHNQYLLRAGGNAMSADLDMGTNAITNVGNVDGVDVSAHQGRHVRGGADEIDGDVLDIDFTPSSYTPSVAPAEVTNVDELSAHLAGIDDALGSAGLVTKSGLVLNATFTGNPKTATVTFSSAFADANYTPVFMVNGTTSFSPRATSIVAGSFVINMGANNINGLVDVRWVAIKHGES